MISSTRWLARFLLLLALALGPGCGVATIEDHPCPESGTDLDYESFGRRFLVTYCQTCHGGIGPARRGAPSSHDFGSLEDTRAWRDRIFERAAFENTTMPPGPDDPPFEERERLGQWLACGAP